MPALPLYRGRQRRYIACGPDPLIHSNFQSSYRPPTGLLDFFTWEPPMVIDRKLEKGSPPSWPLVWRQNQEGGSTGVALRQPAKPIVWFRLDSRKPETKTYEVRNALVHCIQEGEYEFEGAVRDQYGQAP
jgi:hypothetical protein